MKPSLSWVVQPDDGRRVSDIVASMRELGAPARFRLFVNGRRARLEDFVELGDRVELWPQREASGAEAVEILAQRDGVILAYKPASLASETTRQGEDSVVSALIQLLNGGEVRAASRLDIGVSGVMVCTLGRDAARRVVRWREAGQLSRSYLAIASGVLTGSGQWQAALGKGRDRGGRHKAVTTGANTKHAVTGYQVLDTLESSSLLLLRPETGRMHQLRAHAQLAGAPLYGDRLYGGPVQVVAAGGTVTPIERIALHALRVDTPGLMAVSPFPEELQTLWRGFGGSGEPWQGDHAS